MSDAVETTNKIGEIVKLWRKRRGMTQEEVANACGLSTSMIGMLEKGKTSPSIDTLFNIAKCLRVSLGVFDPAGFKGDAIRIEDIPTLKLSYKSRILKDEEVLKVYQLTKIALDLQELRTVINSNITLESLVEDHIKKALEKSQLENPRDN